LEPVEPQPSKARSPTTRSSNESRVEVAARELVAELVARLDVSRNAAVLFGEKASPLVWMPELDP
jgi:hypothetical protein